MWVCWVSCWPFWWKQVINHQTREKTSVISGGSGLKLPKTGGIGRVILFGGRCHDQNHHRHRPRIQQFFHLRVGVAWAPACGWFLFAHSCCSPYHCSYFREARKESLHKIITRGVLSVVLYVAHGFRSYRRSVAGYRHPNDLISIYICTQIHWWIRTYVRVRTYVYVCMYASTGYGVWYMH